MKLTTTSKAESLKADCSEEEGKEIAQGCGYESTDSSLLPANNDAVYANVLSLYVPKLRRIADVTYGKGVFWKGLSRTSQSLVNLVLDLTVGAITARPSRPGI